MLGNVWEWCEEWLDYDYYDYCPINNPPGPFTGKYRVLCGGSWWLSPNLTRSASRFSDIPNHKDINSGFRVIVEADKTYQEF